MLRKLIIRLSLMYKGHWTPLQTLLADEHKSREEISQLQLNKLKKLLKHASEYSEYYKTLFQKIQFHPDDLKKAEDIQKIPFLTKDILKEKLPLLKSSYFSEDDLVKSGTGGSTGVPTHFYYNKAFSRYTLAMKIQNLFWTGWKFGEWIFIVWGSAFDVKKSAALKSKLGNYFFGRRIYPAFNINDDMIKQFLVDIEKYKPAIIQGYNMPLVIVAKYIVKNNITFSYAPKGVVNCAETLFDPQRKLMEQAFGCKVFNRYGGRELSDVAHECKYGNMHINEDLTYVEIVDDNGKPVPDGEMGNIILTGLENFGMPFIRYQVQDMGILAPKDKKCECGLPFRIMAKVLGRSQDIIKLKDGRYLAGEFFPHLFKDFDVKKFQVIQETIDLIIIKFVKGPDIKDAQIEYLKNKIQEYIGSAQLQFEFVEDIPTTKSGKFRFTISKVE